jgi:hypothetical protein
MGRSPLFPGCLNHVSCGINAGYATALARIKQVTDLLTEQTSTAAEIEDDVGWFVGANALIRTVSYSA